MMFERSFNLVEEAQLIKKTVFESIEEKIVSSDLSGKGKPFTTTQIGDWIKERIEKG